MTARVTDSGEQLGEIALRFTPSLTPSQLRLTAAQIAAAQRGGVTLQRSAHRVLSPMGMGLMGQLAAALPERLINFPQVLSSSAHDKTLLPV